MRKRYMYIRTKSGIERGEYTERCGVCMCGSIIISRWRNEGDTRERERERERN